MYENNRQELTFDYLNFENDLFKAVENFMKQYISRKDDVYAFSIHYFPDLTTLIGIAGNTYSHLNSNTNSHPSDKWYFYYKYCEEEWELGTWFDDVSIPLQNYYNAIDKYSQSESVELYELFEKQYKEHVEKIIEICKQALKKIKATDTYKSYPRLYLNVYVREKFSTEELLTNYEELNADLGDTIRTEFTHFLKV